MPKEKKKKEESDIVEIPLPKTKATALDEGEPLGEVGRSLGTVKKVDPTVYQIIQEEAARTGRKPYEILMQFVRNYAIIRYDTWNRMTVAELYEAWQILREMMYFCKDIFFDFTKVIFSGQMTTFAEIVEEAVRRRGMPSPPAEEKALSKLIDGLSPILDMLATLMTNSFTKMMGIKPPQQKLNIPVTIKEENENQKSEKTET